MKKGYAVLVIIMSFVATLYAQNQTTGLISGIVVSESNKKPLEFVNVSLINTKDSSVVTGDVTDAKGKYEIRNVPFGEYFLKFSFISYLEKKSPNLKIDSKNISISMGTTILGETEIKLDEVAVTSNRITLNTSIDRKVYNVEQDIMSKTGSASELLQNIPSVQVDIDGNVSLRGSTNVLILINGKTSLLMGKTRAEVLQQMPANSIEKIEVITNPSAKYKPDGTSGIINIVMKKDTGTGLNGNLSANIGNQTRYNGNTNLNYNPGGYNIFGSLSLRQDDRNSFSEDIRTQYDLAALIPEYYVDNSSWYSHPLSRGLTLGIDCNLDSQNSFGLSGNYFYRGFTRDDKSNKIIKNSNGTVINDYDRIRVDYEYEIEDGVAAYFQHNFSDEDHKLRLEFNASQSPEEEDNHYTNVYRIPLSVNQYDNVLIKQGDRKEQLTFEYSNPLSEQSTFEAGYTGEFNKTDMDFYGEYFNPSLQKFVKDIVKTNHFIYNESIHAGYATYSNSFGALSFLGGLRLEESLIKSNFVSRDSIINNSYFNLYPTLHLSYKLNEATELQLNYSRRANRPEGDDLNPFPEYQDPRNVRAGNPHLLPEFIHSIEFGCQWQNDFLTVVPSIFYRNRYNGFTTITTALNDTTLLTTRMNLSTDQSAGFEFVVVGSLGNIFSANMSANAFYEEIDATNLGFSKNKSTVTWSGNISCNLNLPSATMLQINSSYRSSRLTPQGENRPSFVVNLGIRQDIFDDKLSLVLTVSDIFKTLKRESFLDTSWLNQRSVNTRDSQIIYLGATYHFGKSNKKSKEKSLQYDNNL